MKTFKILFPIILCLIFLPQTILSNPVYRAKPDPGDPSSVTGKRPPKAYKWANKKTKTDKDADGIPDVLEEQPFPFSNLSLTLHPKKKDVIIFIDHVGTDNINKPSATAVQILLNAFAVAPVKGRGGNKGINLIIVTSPGYPASSSSSVGSFVGNSYDWSDVDTMKQYAISTYGLQNTPKVYHYCVSCNNYGGSGSSGISRNNISSYAAFRKGAVDFILSLQGNQSQESYAGATAGTIMHEFGHNLGLTHGGYDHKNYKPNYISIMNYHFQFNGVTYNNAAKYDYSNGMLKPIDERNVKEKKGLGKKAVGYYTKAQYQGYGTVNYNVDLKKKVDWNANGHIDKKGYALNMNYPYDGSLTWLVTEDNWRNVNFTAGGTFPPPAGAPVSAPGLYGPASGELFPSRDPDTPDYPGRFMPADEKNSCLEFTPEIRKEILSESKQKEFENLTNNLKPLKIQSSGGLTVYELAE